MNQENFIINKNQWLKEVCTRCNHFGTRETEKVTQDFYIFQTSCNTYEPELLIIGINPGGNNPFRERTPAELQGYDVNILTDKPYWETDKGTDVIRQNFKRVFDQELEPLLNDSVMMNMVYFNTPTEKELDGLPQDATDFCRTKTIEFIGILNPRKIIFLTSFEPKLRKYGVTGIDYLGCQVRRGVLNSREIYAIPHYGYRDTWKGEKGRLMSEKLKETILRDRVVN